MPNISDKSMRVPRSAIREMFAMQDGLEDVVSFALGEPDFDTPPHILDAIQASYRRNETHYTPNPGIMPLRKAISQSYQQRGLDYSANEILVGTGAISILSLAVTAILNRGDEVLVPDPGWSNYQGLMIQADAVPVPVKLREENRFMYDINDLRAAITPKTKAILLNSPSNPTGGVMNAKVLEQIADLAKEYDLFVLTDEIYRELLWNEEPYTSIASFPGMKERTIIIDGFSKTYAMTGLRLGYAAAPQEIIQIMTKLLENVFACVNQSVQLGGVVALEGTQEPIERMKAEYRKRRSLVVDGLNAIENISCLPPDGAFYAFANIKRTGLLSRDFAIRLLQEKHVVVVPGSGFGEGGEGFIRLSYATNENNIAEGLRRIKEFVEKL